MRFNIISFICNILLILFNLSKYIAVNNFICSIHQLQLETLDYTTFFFYVNILRQLDLVVLLVVINLTQ